MIGSANGQVHKIIRVVATSETSWEDAARAGVAEAMKTIHDLRSATVVKADMLLAEGGVARYRVKLEMAFQLDRSRLGDDGVAGVDVHRYLIVANHTLPSPALQQWVDAKEAIGPAEFHVLVPESNRPLVYTDPTGGVDPQMNHITDYDRLVALEEAEERLDAFRKSFAGRGSRLTGEVGVGDPVSAVQRVMDRAAFDEIVVATQPIGISRWFKLDLPARLERHFRLPVTHLVEQES